MSLAGSSVIGPLSSSPSPFGGFTECSSTEEGGRGGKGLYSEYSMLEASPRGESLNHSEGSVAREQRMEQLMQLGEPAPAYSTAHIHTHIFRPFVCQLLTCDRRTCQYWTHCAPVLLFTVLFRLTALEIAWPCYWPYAPAPAPAPASIRICQRRDRKLGGVRKGERLARSQDPRSKQWPLPPTLQPLPCCSYGALASRLLHRQQLQARWVWVCSQM